MVLEHAKGPVFTVLAKEAKKKFYIKSKSENASSLCKNCQGKDGHLWFNVGDCLLSRYTIRRQLGKGCSAKVVECWDREKEEMVAIKIVRTKPAMCKTFADIEIMLLTHIARKEDYGAHFAQIKNWFYYRRHVCIVFEKLGPCLYSFSEKINFAPLSIDLVRELGRQLLERVAFMHNMRIIHTDLKFQNILLVSEEFGEMLAEKVLSQTPKAEAELFKSSAIKLIDFSAATFLEEDKERTYVVSPRRFRAPEVILGLGWKFPCDVWSVGCILVELCTGEILFNAKEDLEHLAMMERFLGQLPQHMLLKGAESHTERFVEKGVLNWPEGAKRTCTEGIEKIPRIQDVVMQQYGYSGSDFLNLLQGLLRYDPSDRLSAQAALCHSFFTG
ncbi:hypothetical protein AQUCO_00900474v1 [Aquilegia coerulea]|uniref:Protein kinase domain-containing protein n=1 Tax=Aquilegia coerulea TaxID=218851 RepID=A0A2G5EED2_AQUCA|nr:hypothetical protein AQUCO_00900474v1 [Aquilegia coerulea]